MTAAGLETKPENFEKAYSDQQQFREGEQAGGGIVLEVWTNKGTDGLLYTKGEKMETFVRVNVPCYLRFVYHLANGQRALLLDNHFIDESKVNTAYKIPFAFVCDEPFGAECLQALAGTEKFDPLLTNNVGGYDLIQEELNVVLPRLRGMKREQPAAWHAESRIVLTTMDNR